MAQDITEIYHLGEIIPYTFQPGIVVASYFVSLVGAYSTVELLHMRKANRGWLSWLQLALCAVLFGLVAIWGMHFVGNSGILMGNGRSEIQLSYNPGFTALSVFLPILFLFFGFYIVERFGGLTKTKLYGSLMVCGVVSGLAITGMHYVGNFGTANYNLHNDARYVVAAAILAIAACWISFALFFRQKEHWINSWWRRAICACLLAGAVSGMHWVASVGTIYELKSFNEGSSASRDTNRIVAIVMCLLAVVVIFSIAFALQRRRKQLADRAQHVVLASVTFDPDGKLLVTQEGLMPCQKITRQFNQRSFNDEFNVSHPVFQWIFRVSYNWSGVADLIPSMRNHLRSVGGLKSTSVLSSSGALSATHSGIRSPYDESNTDQDYSMIFREQFCVAANELATQLYAPLQELGTLFDEILMTGTTSTEPKGKSLGDTLKRSSTHNMEAGLVIPALFGKGQLLFLSRRVSKNEASRLMGYGYRFASMDQVGDIMARSMQVGRSELKTTVDRLSRCSHEDDSLSTDGTHLACFALRPALRTTTGSWDILVDKRFPWQIPKIELTAKPLNARQTTFLSRLEGRNIDQCINYIVNRMAAGLPQEEHDFLDLFHRRVVTLTDLVPEPFFRQAVFSPKPIRTYAYAQGSYDTSSRQVSILAFCIIPDVHTASVKATDTLTYTPFSLFRCRQHVHKDSPDHAILARRIHQEFSAILAGQKDMDNEPADTSRKGSFVTYGTEKSAKTSSTTSTFGIMWPFSGVSSRLASQQVSPRNSTVHADTSSTRELVKAASRERIEVGTFGGIMVHQDIHIDESTKAEEGSESSVEMKDLGLKSTVGTAGEEAPTFADELFMVTTAKWQHN